MSERKYELNSGDYPPHVARAIDEYREASKLAQLKFNVMTSALRQDVLFLEQVGKIVCRKEVDKKRQTRKKFCLCV